MATLEKMFNVRGKSVIVTGGASGIGRAYAEIMAEQGAKVCIFDIDPAGLDRVVAEIGGDCWGQVVDVGDRPAMAAAFDKAAARHRRIWRRRSRTRRGRGWTGCSPMPGSTPAPAS